MASSGNGARAVPARAGQVLAWLGTAPIFRSRSLGAHGSPCTTSTSAPSLPLVVLPCGLRQLKYYPGLVQNYFGTLKMAIRLLPRLSVLSSVATKTRFFPFTAASLQP